MKTNEFPLTRLPEYALKNVLKMMDLSRLVAFSLVSKKSKASVESLSLEGRSMTVSLNYIVKICFEVDGFPNLHCKFYTEVLQNGMYQGQLYKPPSVIVDQYKRRQTKKYKWECGKFEMKDWIDHFRDIFHRPKFRSLDFCYGDFDLGNVLDHFQNFRRLNVGDGALIVTGQDIMKYSHRIRELDVPARLFPNEKYPSRLLIQNFDYFSIRGYEPLKLNDLLVCGSKNLHFPGMNITGKELNRFIKLWMRGSNPRMEEFCHHFLRNENNTDEIILKGLNAQKMQSGEQRYFKSEVNNDIKIVKDGWDVLRQDGTMATITFSEFSPLCDIRIYVWHSQCIRDSDEEDLF